MKQKFLKIAGVKNEKQFYAKYPTESAFFKAHPEAKELKKARIGSYIGGKQDVIPQYQSYEDYANLVPLSITGKTQEQMRGEAERKEMLDLQRAQTAAAQQDAGGGLLGNLQGLLGGGGIGKGSQFGDIAGGGSDMITPGAGDSIGGMVDVGSFARKGKKVKKAQTGTTEKDKPDVLGKIAQGLPIIGDIAQGFDMLKQMKQQRKELESSAKISDLALQASRTQPERTPKRYVRPEDAVVSPNERFIPGGTGTEILAEYGASIGGNPTEIQNMYNPGDLYSDLGYEPLSESDVVKQYRRGGAIPKAVSGFETFMASGGGAATNNLISAAIPQTGGIGAGSKIGGGVGKGIGMAIGGPAGGAIGEAAGSLLGAGTGAIADAPGAKKEAMNRKRFESNVETMATESSIRGALGNYSSFVRNGGDIPYAEHGWVSHDWQPQKITHFGEHSMEDLLKPPADADMLRTGGNIRQNNLSELDNFNFGGSLKTHWGGRAEVDSYNPYLPGTGETVMFKGNQHSESDGKGNTGIGVSYGPQEHDSYTDYAEYGSEQAVKKAKVEVENREPAIQLPEPSPYSPMQNFASGGQANNNNYAMTVFGALKINEHAANEIGDKQAKGRTFKTYIAEINKKENEANNKLAKANEQLENLKVVTPFDRLKLNSLQSTIQGENEKLKDYAVKKVTAAEVQNAYNETAEELGLDADALAKGKIKPSKDMGNAKYGKEIEKAQKGKLKIPTVSKFFKDLGINTPEKVANIQPRLDSLVTSADLFPTKPKYNMFAKPESEYTESAGSDGKKSSSSSAAAKPSSSAAKKTVTAPKTTNKAISSTGAGGGGNYEGIVDYLKRTKKPSDFTSRKKLAEEKGIKNYRGTANQNIQLLNMLKNDKGVSAAQAPSGTATVDPQTSSTYSYSPIAEFLPKGAYAPKSEFLSGDIPKINFKSSTPLGELKETSPAAEKKKGKTDWLDFAKIASTQLANLLRRPLQEDLRGDQLYGEMLAKAQNQLQPVQAQTYQPLLDTPFDVSFQDQLNQNQATLNAFLKQPGVANNPAAMQALAAQKYQADSQVLADQFRTNQALRAGVFSKNRDTLNDAALKNLAILDQQYTRQAEALSKTKATDLEIAKSISDKIAKNRLENRTFAAYSNLFPQYGFNRNMMAISQLPTFFGTGMVPGLSPEDAKSWQEWYDEKEKKKKEDSTTAKYGKNLKKHFKNGSIVKSLKNI